MESMNTKLLKERQCSKKRDIALPTIEAVPEKQIEQIMGQPSVPKLDEKSCRSMSGNSQYSFSVLAKIVKHMRVRHQNGQDHPLAVDEILDETKQRNVAKAVKHWLRTEALMNNPKIEVIKGKAGNKFLFKPVYKIRDGKSLIRLLKHYDLEGLGGVLMEEIQESLPHCDEVLKNRSSEILVITRPTDKKKVLFYNDRSINFTVDEVFKNMWRSTTVDTMDDAKIEAYLEKQGIRSMEDLTPKKPVMKRKKVIVRKRPFQKPLNNEHLAHVLETYEHNTLTQEGFNPIKI